MRKLICLLMAMMLAAPFALAEDLPSLHTIWDMPLTVTIDEFEDFLQSEVGIETVRDGITITKAKDSPLTMFDLPVSMMAYFGEQAPHTLERMVFFRDKIRAAEDPPAVAPSEHFLRLADVFNGRYGEPTCAGMLLWRIAETGTLESYNMDLPTIEGRLDFEGTLAAMREWEGGGMIQVDWCNVTLWLSVRGQYQELRAEVSAAIPLREPRIPFDRSDAFSGGT